MNLFFVYESCLITATASLKLNYVYKKTLIYLKFLINGFDQYCVVLLFKKFLCCFLN